MASAAAPTPAPAPAPTPRQKSAESSGKQLSRTLFSVLGSLTIAILIGVIVSQYENIKLNILPDSMWGGESAFATHMIILLPLLSYIITTILSIVYQKVTFGDVNAILPLWFNLGVVLTNLVLALVLWAENLPILQWIFGEYAPRNPDTGIQYKEDHPDYQELNNNEERYKLSFFSGIVKSVISMYIDEPMQNGFVYFYWTFWGTLLPWFIALYFLEIGA
jgi:hypothetical protein